MSAGPVAPVVPGQVLCEHHVCRCARAAELAAMAGSTGEARYLAEAIACHGGQVRCRLPKGKAVCS
jgi:hypothetical protein